MDPTASGPALTGRQMLDFTMIAAGIGFFAVALLYALACERM
ncbi:MAG TPA: hypothetical protein VJ770_05185 [Stellaceae bacterium]|nr:hypothetical protein [Stellaceae bacterium]